MSAPTAEISPDLIRAARLRHVRQEYDRRRHTPVVAVYSNEKYGRRFVGSVCLHCGMTLTEKGRQSVPGSKAHERRVRAEPADIVAASKTARALAGKRKLLGRALDWIEDHVPGGEKK